MEEIKVKNERALDEVKQRNEELKLMIIKRNQEKEHLTDTLQSLIDERNHWSAQLEYEEQKFKDNNADDLISNGNSDDNPADKAKIIQQDEEQTSFILNEIDNILKNTWNANHNDYIEKDEVIEDIEQYNWFNNYVLVIFITSEDIISSSFKAYCQTFNIDSSTTFINLKAAILNFWTPTQIEDYEYKLEWFNNNVLKPILNDTEKIDTFWKQIGNITVPKFVFYLDTEQLQENWWTRIAVFNKQNDKNNIVPKKRKEGNNQYDEENENQTENIKDKIDDDFLKFVMIYFMGITDYVIKKFLKLKLLTENLEMKIRETATRTRKIVEIISVIFLVWYIAILFIAWWKKTTPDKWYSNKTAIKEWFIGKSHRFGSYVQKEHFLDNMATAWSPIFKGGTLSNWISMVSPLKLYFYRNKSNGKCNPWYNFDKTCYSSGYTSSNRESEDLVNWKTNTWLWSQLPRIEIKYPNLYVDSSLSNTNYLTPATMETYYMNLFKDFDKTINDFEFYILGEREWYTGKGNKITISSQFVNIDVLRSVLDITQSDSILWDTGWRGIQGVFTFFHYPASMFYYGSLLYEFGVDGSIKGPNYQITPFKMHIYVGASGKICLILDIIIAIYSCFKWLYIITLMIIAFKRRKKRMKSPIYAILNIRSFFEIISILLILISLIISFFFFIGNSFPYGEVLTDRGYNELIDSTNFYNYLFFYDWVHLLQVWSFISIVIHLCILILNIKYMKVFLSYIKEAMIESIVWYLLYVIIALSLAIYGYNWFGINIQDFNEIATSLTWVVLISIDHFIDGLFGDEDFVYCTLFIGICVFIFHFYFSSIWLANYLDVYRKVCLKRGYWYERRYIAYEKEKEKIAGNAKKKDEEEYNDLEMEEEVEIEEEEEVEVDEEEEDGEEGEDNVGEDIEMQEWKK